MNQYNQIGEKYSQIKKQHWRKCIEEFTLNQLIGHLENKTILDLACGDGHYAKKFYQQNPLKIVGVDISEEMIRLAKPTPDGKVEYIVGDASQLNLDKKFDIVTGIYLLNYAQTEEELDKFVKVIKQHLNNDGMFIGINSYMSKEIVDYKKYGFEKLVDDNIIRWKYYDDEEELICQFDNYYLENEVYERVFAQNNLSLHWIYPDLDPTLDIKEWEDFLDESPIIFIEAHHI